MSNMTGQAVTPRPSCEHRHKSGKVTENLHPGGQVFSKGSLFFSFFSEFRICLDTDKMTTHIDNFVIG